MCRSTALWSKLTTHVCFYYLVTPDIGLLYTKCIYVVHPLSSTQMSAATPWVACQSTPN